MHIIMNFVYAAVNIGGHGERAITERKRLFAHLTFCTGTGLYGFPVATVAAETVQRQWGFYMAGFPTFSIIQFPGSGHPLSHITGNIFFRNPPPHTQLNIIITL